ncbi:hypothetical protein C8A01DRAFT_31783 [Parachaetomium inaequale]|uniref:Erythromycin biosynthesis protein CIII-like C-terminal domain-containing protein n=1 Tax=Parachaetomium inaequale TaxID=2588326 RepID=A0AAN6SVW3_9PEZI|nr:hypothetical protein C8A01DRAFT_31783 [Parachaetomium inaequale]
MEERKQTAVPKRVLLFTNSEHGQANVFLATSYALLTEDEDVEVHFASFPPIQSFVSTTSNHAQQDKPGSRPIIFHTIDGPDMVTAWTRPETVAEQAALNNPSMLSLVNAIRRTLVLLKVTLPWTGPEFVQIMHSVTNILHAVQPDIIAVDPAFSPALTALRHIKAKFIILTPNTIKDFAMPLQPNGEALWKYPCLGTSTPYPLPATSIPRNILLILLSLLVSLLDPNRRSLAAYLSTQIPGAPLTTLATLSLNPSALNTKFLVANLPEMEFPLKVIPPHIVPCGPMLRPARPVAEVDPDLGAWLRSDGPDGGPVVYVNLGTHVFYDEGTAGEMARAVKVLLGSSNLKVRVLWKIPRRGKEVEGNEHGGGEGRWVFGSGGVVERVLGEEVRTGVVKVVEWIEAEPSALLEAGSVVCAVHHGGANSFLEAVHAGVPQVVLPVWMDTYDFARRTEILGIGRWGNRLADKLCEGNELGAILAEVVVGERASAYAQRARELAELCKKSGGGRVSAARHILAEIEGHSQSPSQGEKESDLLLDGHSNGHC